MHFRLGWQNLRKYKLFPTLAPGKYGELSIVQANQNGSFWLVKKARKRKYFADENALRLVGAKMREVRMKKGFTIENFANTSGMDYTQISKMESGKVNFSISYLFRVAQSLGVTPKELLP